MSNNSPQIVYKAKRENAASKIGNFVNICSAFSLLLVSAIMNKGLYMLSFCLKIIWEGILQFFKYFISRKGPLVVLWKVIKDF